MSRNRGQTSLKCRRRSTDPMREYDRLPPELRRWLSNAVLPWRAGSVLRAFNRALARDGDPALALRQLDALQARRVAKDAPAVWGPAYPGGTGHGPHPEG